MNSTKTPNTGAGTRGQLQADLDLALDRSTITQDASPIDWPELCGPELLGWIAKAEPPKRPVTERDACPLDWRLVLIGPRHVEPLMRSFRMLWEPPPC